MQVDNMFIEAQGMETSQNTVSMVSVLFFQRSLPTEWVWKHSLLLKVEEEVKEKMMRCRCRIGIIDKR